jgi:hypothetical protein
VQIQLIAETESDTLAIRAINAWAMEQGKALEEAFGPWITDLSSAAVNRGPLSEASVQDAEVRGRAARTLREAQATLAEQRAEVVANEARATSQAAVNANKPQPK